MTVIRRAEVDGHRVDVRIVGGTVTAIAGTLDRRPGEELVHADGGALLPGLVDHHLHLLAMAAARLSTRCGPPAVRDRAALGKALRDAPADRHGWVRGIGYHESVAGDLDAAALDALHPSRPVRVQHRSGALWMLNGAAVHRLGGPADGRLWRADAWLRERLPLNDPPDLDAVCADLAHYGVTAVTDATPDLDAAAMDALAGAGLRVHLLGAPLTGRVPEPLTVGPYKIVLADSGLPALDELTDRIRAAHRVGRAVAAHCVTRESLVLLLAALEDAGGHPGDRIEHAALVPAELVDELARRGLSVVTQPGFLADRGDDYLRDLPAADHPDLYRAATLCAAGVRTGLSSDAPYGPADPWVVMAAAVTRQTPSGTVAGPGERLTPRQALDAYLAPPEGPGGPPRRGGAGLILLDRPLAQALEELPRNPVAMVWAQAKS